LTEKENYLKVLHCEQPEWVPIYGFGAMPGSEYPPATVMYEPIILSEHRINGGGKDIWGVEYVATYETGGALLPKPGDFILTDITKWRDVIKAPDVSDVDWIVEAGGCRLNLLCKGSLKHCTGQLKKSPDGRNCRILATARASVRKTSSSASPLLRHRSVAAA